MGRPARKRAWHRKTLPRSRRATCRSDRRQGVCRSPRHAEHAACRIEGPKAPAVRFAQRHVEARETGKTYKGAILTPNACGPNHVLAVRTAGARSACSACEIWSQHDPVKISRDMGENQR